jgi:uncharacterized membrane protein
MSEHVFTLLAGAFAALAGVCGKVAADSTTVTSATSNESLQSVLRAAAALGVLVCNALMWHCFVRSLHRSNSVSSATLNALVNLCFTALFGWAFFGELLSLRWCVGACLLSSGVLLVLRGTRTVHKRKIRR